MDKSPREKRTCPLCGEELHVHPLDRIYLINRDFCDLELFNSFDAIRCERIADRIALSERMSAALAKAHACTSAWSACREFAIVTAPTESADDVRMVAELEGWDVRRYNADKRVVLLVKR